MFNIKGYTISLVLKEQNNIKQEGNNIYIDVPKDIYNNYEIKITVG